MVGRAISIDCVCGDVGGVRQLRVGEEIFSDTYVALLATACCPPPLDILSVSNILFIDNDKGQRNGARVQSDKGQRNGARESNLRMHGHGRGMCPKRPI